LQIKLWLLAMHVISKYIMRARYFRNFCCSFINKIKVVQWQHTVYKGENATNTLGTADKSLVEYWLHSVIFNWQACLETMNTLQQNLNKSKSKNEIKINKLSSKNSQCIKKLHKQLLNSKW